MSCKLLELVPNFSTEVSLVLFSSYTKAKVNKYRCGSSQPKPSTRCRSVVSFAAHPLYTKGKSPPLPKK